MDDKKIVRNFDGEEIDLLKDDLIEKLTFESANFIRRMLSYIIDLLLVIVIWYLCFNFLFKNFDNVDQFMRIIGELEDDFQRADKLKEASDLLWRLFMDLILIWICAKGVYFTLMPAIIGNGRTIGKLLAGIGVVDVKTLEEISPTRLILREILGRCIIETLFVIPLIVSVVMAFVRDDGRSLHDVLAKTNVIKLELYDEQPS